MQRRHHMPRQLVQICRLIHPVHLQQAINLFPCNSRHRSRNIHSNNYHRVVFRWSKVRNTQQHFLPNDSLNNSIYLLFRNCRSSSGWATFQQCAVPLMPNASEIPGQPRYNYSHPSDGLDLLPCVSAGCIFDEEISHDKCHYCGINVHICNVFCFCLVAARALVCRTVWTHARTPIITVQIVMHSSARTVIDSNFIGQIMQLQIKNIHIYWYIIVSNWKWILSIFSSQNSIFLVAFYLMNWIRGFIEL